ncbi:MAG TPA: triose-phosphate isomerase, partial [Cyclobacteriaceae bacterium]
MRKKIVAGNWKMNKTLAEATGLVAELMTLTNAEVKNNAEVVLCTPFPYLINVKSQLGNSKIAVGAQNCSEHE